MKTILRPAARYLRQNHSTLFYQVERAWQWTEDLKRLRYPVIDSEVPLLDYARQAGWPVTVHAEAQLVERLPSQGITEDMAILGKQWSTLTHEGPNSAMYVEQLRSRMRYPVETAFTTRIPEAHVSPRGDIIINADGTPLRVRNWSERAHCEGIDEAEIVEGPVVSLLSTFATSFSHWITDSLMRIAFLPAEERSSVRYLVPTPRRAFIDAYLDYFGIRQEQRVYVSSWIFCEELILIEAVHRSNLPHPAVVEAFRTHFDVAETVGSKRIFIGRRTRKLLNEDAIFGIAQDFGFERHYLEDLSMREQVDLFRQAEYITGYHGAGFANMLYAPRQAKVIEVINPAKWDHFYLRLANILDQEHWHVFVDYKPHVWDASIAPEKWEKLLRLATGSDGGAEAIY